MYVCETINVYAAAINIPLRKNDIDKERFNLNRLNSNL